MTYGLKLFCDLPGYCAYFDLMVQVNPVMVGALEKAGLKFVGTDESGKRMEVSYLNFAVYSNIVEYAGS